MGLYAGWATNTGTWPAGRTNETSRSVDHASDKDGGFAGLSLGLVSFLIIDADRPKGAVGNLPIGRVGEAVARPGLAGVLLVDLARSWSASQAR